MNMKIVLCKIIETLVNLNLCFPARDKEHAYAPDPCHRQTQFCCVTMCTVGGLEVGGGGSIKGNEFTHHPIRATHPIHSDELHLGSVLAAIIIC